MRKMGEGERKGEGYEEGRRGVIWEENGEAEGKGESGMPGRRGRRGWGR